MAAGTRVAIDPCIPCLPRGMPPCANCARGWTSSCLNLDSRVLSSGGRSASPRTSAAGGPTRCWRTTSMLHPLPDAVGDRGASLYEPVSIACHGLLRAAPHDGDPVLIVGAGIIGLAALAALRGLFPRVPGDGAGATPHQADGGHRVRRGQRRAERPRQRPLGGAGLAGGCARRRAQEAPDAHGRVPLRGRGRRLPRAR